MMSQTKATGPTARISSFLILVILVTFALSFIAVIFGISIIDNIEASSVLLLLGFIGILLSIYVLFQTRRRLAKLRIEVPPVVTTIECQSCHQKTIREFQRGDYIFKEGEPCPKCKDRSLITAIYREVMEKDKEKEKTAF